VSKTNPKTQQFKNANPNLLQIYLGFTSGPLKTCPAAFFPFGNNFFETPERCSASEQEQDLCDPNGDLATKLVGAKQILHS
jgi:hypothetical protein